MSEVQARPATRGRSSARGGRGGHGARGPRKTTNGDHVPTSTPSDTTADQGELGELKRKYLTQLSTLKELFPDWSDVDLVLTLQETDGDLQSTIERITEGNVSQFAEVKKTKDRSRSKVKDTTSSPSDTLHSQAATRGSRTRAGQDSVRGSRGRPERGRGGTRGGRGGASTNGTRTIGPDSIPTTESSVWDTTPAPVDPKQGTPAWDLSAVAPAAATAAEPEAPKTTSAPQSGAKKTWASMFAAPKPPPASKPVTQSPPVQAEPESTPADVPAHEVAAEETVAAEPLPIPPVSDELPEDETVLEEDGTQTPTKPTDSSVGEITPSKDELTEDNVEHLPDASNPPPTETAASTVASSKDIGSIGTVATPLSNAGQAPIGRPAMGGYATTAHKATGAAHRSASFQKRLLEQQEAVVMPGNHAVDRAAVQFGSMGLNGNVEALDVDEDREEAETRTQPPQHSPVAQPRAALPPAPRQPAPPAEHQPQEALPTPKQAPGLPPVPQHQQSPQASLGPQAMQQQGSQTGQQYGQFGRYGQSAEASAPAQKPYDPFGQQAQTSQYDSYPSQAQTAGAPQQQGQSQAAGFSAPSEYSSQYFTTDQQRNAYNNYYQNYNQQTAASQQEAGSAQQRTGSAFGTGPSDSSFPPSQQAQQAPSRYGEAQNSGHTTPNPALSAQHPSGPASQQGQHMHQQPHTQPGHAGGYPYNHPYYGSPYYQNYMNQYAGYGQQGYGAFGGGKGMYNQPHHGYGVSPQASYDQHSSSPANAGGFGQSSMHGRDSALGGGLGEYGRSGSAQPSQAQHNASAGAGFGGVPDLFSRSQAGGYQNQPYGQQQGAQQTATEDSLKPFGDSKASGGPSPSALGQPGRPGSATNNTPGQTSQSGLPPPQSHQQGGFGGGAYPSHLNQLQGGQGNQYGGGLGGLGGQGQQHAGAQSHQQSGGYGQYGGFGGAGYGSYNRGGWGTNYGQH
ncbi:hypothetical protein BU16DRAFT_241430 [Lophium mytilinum]|uniref:RNA polymerase II degradation factor 1 n=1 Tax=Lophium mytilinum TaxID=390894 RepID=A0A6A6R6S0_9PEZI|nr:hypothetical protein BU16DRAFT_241430 [Lophium mytilinum]